MPIVDVGQSAVGLYAVPVNKTIPSITFHWKINCTNLRDPNGQANLRPFDGRDERVQLFLMEDPRVRPLLDACRMIAEDKMKWTSIAFYDFHGKWISAGMVELAAKELDKAGFSVSKTFCGLGFGK
jgi:hypothetical protein